MYDLVRSSTVLIDSTKRSAPAACDYSVSFNSDLVSCESGQLIKVTLESFTCQLTWGWIQAADAAFAITLGAYTFPISVEAGNPTLPALARAITLSFFGTSAVDYTLFRCSYDAVQNSLVFASQAGPLTLVFPSAQTAAVYGFATATPPAAATVRGTVPINPFRYKSLVVSANGLTPYSTGNGTNLADGSVSRTTMLASIPVGDVAPWTLIDWHNSYDAFGMYISDRRVNVINFKFANYAGDPLTALPDHQMCLRFDVYDVEDPSHTTLGGIHDTLNTMLMHQALSAPLC